MSQDEKPKSIIKADIQQKDKANNSRKSISFNRITTVATYNYGESAQNPFELREEAIQQVSNSGIMTFSDVAQEKQVEENLLAEDSRFGNASFHRDVPPVLAPPQPLPILQFSERKPNPPQAQNQNIAPQNIGTQNIGQSQNAGLNVPSQPSVPRKLTPDKSDAFRQRLSQITKKTLKLENQQPLPKPTVVDLPAQSPAPPQFSFAPSLPIPPAAAPIEQSKIAEPVLRKKRISEIYRQSTIKPRNALGEEDVRRLRQEVQQLDDAPSNNKKRLDQLKAAQEQRQRSRLTLNQRDLFEMLQNEDMSIKKQAASPKPKQQHKVAEKVTKRVTMGINDIAAFLNAQQDQVISLPVPLRSPDGLRSPQFRGMVPSPHRITIDDNDYLEQRARVVAFLQQMTEISSQLPPVQPLTPQTSSSAYAKKKALTEKLARLQEQDREMQARSKANAQLIKQKQARIAALKDQINIEQELNLLFGVESMEVINCPGEQTEQYTEFNIEYKIFGKIRRKRDRRQPELLMACSIIAESETDVLSTKNIVAILKDSFPQNCFGKNVFECVVFLESQYYFLTSLRDQIEYVRSVVDVSDVVISNNQKLVIAIKSRRHQNQETQIRITLNKFNWTLSMKVFSSLHQQEANTCINACTKLSQYALINLIDKLRKKIL